MDHPMVRQTIEDCLTEAMDVEGFLEVLRGLHDGSIEKKAVDTPEPSAFARGILSSQPYTFLDDAPLEERRTQAVLSRRILDTRTADEIGILDAEAIARVRGEAWPQPETAEEVHEALLWMGYVDGRGGPSLAAHWLDELAAAGRVVREGDRWFAAEATRDPRAVLRGRLEALGPDRERRSAARSSSRPTGVGPAHAHRRPRGLVRPAPARPHPPLHGRAPAPRDRARLGRAVPAVPRLLAARRSRVPARGAARRGRRCCAARRLRGAGGGVGGAASCRRACAATSASGSTSSRPRARSRGAGSGARARRRSGARRSRFAPREDLDAWMALAAANAAGEEPAGAALEVLEALARRGAMFLQELARETRQPPAVRRGGPQGADRARPRHVRLLRRAALVPRPDVAPQGRRPRRPGAGACWQRRRRRRSRAEFVARRMLARTGVVFRKTLAREKQPVPWRDVARVLRTLEARGEVRGGRFVAGFDGEQYALPEAVTLLRAMRRRVGLGRRARRR